MLGVGWLFESVIYLELAALLGGRLLSNDRKAFTFLIEMLNSEPSDRRPSSPVGFLRREREDLVAWCQEQFRAMGLVEVRSRDFCSDSVGAWMNYPVDYEFGYTWFHEAEWQAGNRRSVCWSKTDR